MSFLTGFALRRRSVTILFVLLVFLLGVSTWSSIPAELFPQVEVTTVQIVTFLPGSNPDAMVNDVTEPLEDAITGMKGLDNIESTSFTNRSVVLANFVDGTDMDAAESDVISAVAGVDLHEEATSPSIQKQEPNSQPIIQISVFSKTGRPIPELQRIIDERVVPKVEAVDGTFSVDLIGEVEEQVIVEVDLNILEDLGITLKQVSEALAENNVNLPAGDINDRGQNFVVRTAHELGSLEEVKNIVIGFEKDPGILIAFSRLGQPVPQEEPPELAGGEDRQILIGDVANVMLGTAKASSISRTNGEPSLSISVTKEEDANTVDVADGVLEAIDRVRQTLPSDIEFITISNDGPAVLTEVRSLAGQGVQGFLLAIIVVFAFLLNLRPGLMRGTLLSLRPTCVIAVTIPSSIFAGVLLIGLIGLSLNMMTLAGLAIAIGRVVDDGIVVLENMYRHIQLGEDNFEAGLNATREVGGSVFGSTIATIAVFAPLAFIPGIAGSFFFPMAAAVTFALLASTVVALTVVPVFGAMLLRADDTAVAAGIGGDTEGQDSIISRAYTPIIRLALRYKPIALVGALLLVVGSLMLMQFLPVTFLPPSPSSFIQIDLELPPGTSVSRTLAEVAQIEEILDALKDAGHVAAHQVTLGSPKVTTGPGANATGFEFASFVVSLPEEFPGDIDDQIRVALPAADDITHTVTRVENIPTSSDLELRIFGPNFSEVTEVARQLEAGVREIHGIINISSDVSGGRDEVIITPHLRDAARYGLTTKDVAGQVKLYIGGTAVTDVNFEGVDMDVVLRAQPEDVDQIDKVRSLPIQGLLGQVSLGSISEVSIRQGPTTISRLDSDRSATISGLVIAEDTVSVGAQVNKLVAATNIPSGVEVNVGGIFADISDAFSQLIRAMAIGLILIFLILAAIMGGLTNPSVILLSMPLALVGGIVALFVTGTPLGISGMMGFLMLIGIVVTNALVLIEFVDQLRGRGYSVDDALIVGGRTRVRPILMTACTTTIALVPLAIGLGGGTGIVGTELATVVIGGLVSSTILTLVVVPVLYSLLHQGWPGSMNWIRGIIGQVSQSVRGQIPPRPMASRE